MSLVENIINQISVGGGITKPQGFDLNDDTFAKLLEKATANSNDTNSNFVGEMGIPAGLQIEPFNGVEHAEAAQDQLEAVGETKQIGEISEPIEIKEINVGDYFSSLLKTSTRNENLMDFAKKHAASFYAQQSKPLILDSTEFVTDLLQNPVAN